MSRILVRFFFSSRRRHTRFDCDWSSDVCSSDLAVMVAVPAWLFYEVTIANLAGPSDDRSSRLRIWTIVSTIVLTGCCGIVASAAHQVKWAFAQVGFMFAFFLLNILMVAGEPLGPSRRVEVVWQRLGVGRAS